VWFGRVGIVKKRKLSLQKPAQKQIQAITSDITVKFSVKSAIIVVTMGAGGVRALEYALHLLSDWLINVGLYSDLTGNAGGP
jgi:hypothetical protein